MNSILRCSIASIALLCGQSHAVESDRYGGNPALKLKATGWFHVEQLGGRWFFVTPKGNAFLSLVGTDPGETIRQDEFGVFSSRFDGSERQRLPNRFAFSASPWAVGGKIFCLNESGICFVLRAGEKFEQLHTNALDGAMCMSTPALAGDRLLIRTNKHLYSIRSNSTSP